MILNTRRIHNSFWRNFHAIAKQMPSKVLFVGKKNRRPRTAAVVRSLRAKIVIFTTVNELKIIIFVLNYLTVLVYTKTIIQVSVSG